MTVLVTGCAGFIGFHVTLALLKRGDSVIGVDNLNSYYNVSLKHARLDIVKEYNQFEFIQHDIQDSALKTKLEHKKIDRIIHLAAQAGVRYSLEAPLVYGESNLMGHLMMLEIARAHAVQHFVYASSSSVYGSNTKLPFSVSDRVDHPISLYAATKKANELMSHAYSHLFHIPTTGLRFFTVYGPFGRPDMSAFLFARAILEQKPMRVFNHGNMRRNFTFIDDIVAGTISALDHVPPTNLPYKIYNIGNNKSENLMDFIRTIEELLGKSAIIEYCPMQAGDVKETIADIEDTQNDLGFEPKTSIQEGLCEFITWYKEHYS